MAKLLFKIGFFSEPRSLLPHRGSILLPALFQVVAYSFSRVLAVSHCGMAAPCSKPEAQLDPPSPSAYRVVLTKQQSSLMKQAANDFAHTSVYGRVIGHSPSKADIRDWLQSTLYLEDNHIEEVALMGRGIFWLKLSSARAASDMVRRSPTSVGDKIILMVPSYRGFSTADFDACFRIPRHPVTLVFPGLAIELRPIIKDLGAHFGWVMQDTFVDTVAATGVPKVHVAVLNPSSLPAKLKIVTDASTITQSLVVIGQPSQCLQEHCSHVCSPIWLGRACPTHPLLPTRPHSSLPARLNSRSLGNLARAT